MVFPVKTDIDNTKSPRWRFCSVGTYCPSGGTNFKIYAWDGSEKLWLYSNKKAAPEDATCFNQIDSCE